MGGKQKVLIFGGSGMIGHMLFQQLSQDEELEVFATIRTAEHLPLWPPHLMNNILDQVNVKDIHSVLEVFARIKPDTVINCIGLTKRLKLSENPLLAIKLNAEWPQLLALLCKSTGAKLIHMSTDCVFNGQQGNYSESDIPNATDLYGRTKTLGEVSADHCLTLRTSMIGHELRGKTELLEWFLAQIGTTNGFTRAIFSGITTLEMARILSDYILPRPDLTGLYHVSAEPISKYDLLTLLAKQYDKSILIEPCDDFVIDRSLKSAKFQQITGYKPPAWETMAAELHQNYIMYKEVGC